MNEVMAHDFNSTNLVDFQREIVERIAEFCPHARLIVELTNHALFELAKPIEWLPEDYDGKEKSEANLEDIPTNDILKELRGHRPRNRTVIIKKQLGDFYLYLFYPYDDSFSPAFPVPIEVSILNKIEIQPKSLEIIESLSDKIAEHCFNILIQDKSPGFQPADDSQRTNLLQLKEELATLKNSLYEERRISSALINFSATLSKGGSLSELVEESIRSLGAALDCSQGICFAKEQQDKVNRELKVISHYGVPEAITKLLEIRSAPEIVNWVSDSSELIIMPLSNKVNNLWWISRDINISQTAVVVPLSLDQTSVGVLVLLSNAKESITDFKINFLKAAAGQLALVIRQYQLSVINNSVAEEQKRLAKHNAALYRFTHELSTLQSLEEIFQTSFKIMHEELGIERFWIGLLNEPGTRVIGQAAYGPGWKRKLIEINIDISNQSHPLAEVVKTRSPRIIKEVDDVLRGLGLKRFIERNDIQGMGIMPLVSSGQILGVLAFEVKTEKESTLVEESSMLLSFTSELATAIISKRLEERIAASETMRAAGLLAAGIAHNFNNLLQGVLGQASLLELYPNNAEQVLKSAKVIGESATKGAGLVKQLLSFAYLEEPFLEEIGPNELIERNKIAFQRLLSEQQFIRYNLKADIALCKGDPRQIIRIISALLINASDAMEKNGVVEIFTDEVSVNRQTPHYEVPFGSYIIFGIRDNGVGMDAETKRRCFEPFFTTKNIDPSSGLSLSGGGMGLAASYALAKKNGGRLVVDSRKGQGSLFTLFIPKAAEKEKNLGDLIEVTDNRQEGGELKPKDSENNNVNPVPLSKS